jgi:hypothetical protein
VAGNLINIKTLGNTRNSAATGFDESGAKAAAALGIESTNPNAVSGSPVREMPAHAVSCAVHSPSEDRQTAEPRPAEIEEVTIPEDIGAAAFHQRLVSRFHLAAKPMPSVKLSDRSYRQLGNRCEAFLVWLDTKDLQHIRSAGILPDLISEFEAQADLVKPLSSAPQNGSQGQSEEQTRSKRESLSKRLAREH